MCGRAPGARGLPGLGLGAGAGAPSAARGDASGPVRHFVYMLRCADGSLYTGAAKHWQDRLKLHMNGRAAKYTRSRRPVHLVRLETHPSKSAALRAEAAIKRLPKQEKEHYVLAGGPIAGASRVRPRGMPGAPADRRRRARQARALSKGWARPAVDRQRRRGASPSRGSGREIRPSPPPPD